MLTTDNGMLMEEFGQIDSLTCSAAQMKPDGSCPYDTGSSWVATMGMDLEIADCLWVLLGMYVFFRLWAFGMLVLIPVDQELRAENVWRSLLMYCVFTQSKCALHTVFTRPRG